MLKIFKVAAVLLCISSAAIAQTKVTTEFSAHVGLNAATINVDNDHASYRYGVNLGANADFFFSPSWSIKTGLNYDQKGWTDGFIRNTGGGSATTDYHLDYLTVPVLANWHFGRTKNWYLQFGLYNSFLLSAKETALDNDVKDFFQGTEAGLDLGIGVKIPVSERNKFFIEFNGQGAFNDVFKDNAGSTARNGVSAINIGLTF